MPRKKKRFKVIVIGASAGGIEAVREILSGLKRPMLSSVVIVLHIAAGPSSLLPEIFSYDTEFLVKEAQPGMPLEKETIYIAPPDYHLSIESNETLSLSTEDPVNYSRPSIDVLFESAAHAYKSEVLAILLTGANSDGAHGAQVIKKFGGKLVVQDPKEAAFPTMPESALELIEPDKILLLSEIRTMLTKLREIG